MRHLRVAMRSPEFTAFMTTYAGMMAEGTAPGRDIMTASEGITLEYTEHPDKLRPINLGEVIYQVCAGTSMRKNREPGDLMDSQLGSGTANGVEPLIWLKKEHLEGKRWPADGVLEIDRSNAYNTCLLYTSPSPRDATLSRMPSSA